MNKGKEFCDVAVNHGFMDQLSGGTTDASKLSTCIQCGSCSSSCPAADSKVMTARRLWRAVQSGMEQEVMASKDYWACTACALCEERCPRGIPLSSIMIRLRQLKVMRDGMASKVEAAVANLKKSRNITGDQQDNRFLWIENMDLDEKERADLFKDRASTVYFTGCVSSLFPQVYKIPQVLTGIMLKTDPDFTLLKEEWCCGYPPMALGSGSEGAVDLARHNVEEIVAKGASTVLVSCPTCYYMLKRVYPKVLKSHLPFKVMHYSQLLVDKIAQLETKFIDDEVVVTYHDPCDLGRKLGITSEPRQLIKALPGVKLVEMRFNGQDSKCCGGGGSLEMIDPELAGRIAQERVRDAAETGVGYLLTACQQCKRTLQNAVRKSRLRLRVYDLLEFIDARYKTGRGGAGK